MSQGNLSSFTKKYKSTVFDRLISGSFIERGLLIFESIRRRTGLDIWPVPSPKKNPRYITFIANMTYIQPC